MSTQIISRPHARRAAPVLGAILVLAALATAPQARAHAVLDTATATAGSYHKLVVRIGHGCKGSPTVEVSVGLPDGVGGGKPQPKAGWQVATTKEKLAEPFRDGHGVLVTDRVAHVTWTGGPLDDAHFDEFAISVRLPNRPGETLRFPVVQRCQTGEHRWVEMPAPGQRPGELKEPAPGLMLLPR
ncbi:uncharacterized protein YcnI [Stella humosa]|uniref:Uncharacterized protein YcnI n=1 Tax=Stella humosa TaxID=94 RepID=A0A3N1ME56_9PROT|nr:YcnI family protein [Stella humosa]ROQ01405.1 uncharacterized protein YcnI [Stella humosa]BBK31781.1 hypothetical protein STHU_24150 [Stella humosa]